MTVNDESSVYVGGLAYEATEEQVRKAFKEFGEIVAVKIVEGQDGQSRGYGFVTYSTPEAASDAIYGMNGKVIAGRSIKVNGVKNKSDRSMTRESSYRDRDRERGDRDIRTSRDRDRDRGRERHSPKRSKRSPVRSSVRDRSPAHKRHRNGRSRTRSASPNSFSGRDRRERVDKSKQPKGATVEDSKLKEDLAKTVESRHDRRDEVAMLQADLDRASKLIEELSNKEEKLEATLAKASAAFKERVDFFKKIQLAFLEVRECQNKLKAAEAEFQELLLGISLEAPDDENIAFTFANGDVSHGEDARRASVSR